jgi:tetratricopeptide (TPR) repeat protein/TolA-binding protein
MLQKSLDAAYLPDLYFHMAELYVERSRYEHARALAEQEKSGSELSGDASLVVQLTKQLAIETYEKILSEFSDYANRDQVLFFQGHEYRELGLWDDVHKTYEKLIDTYPTSDWAQQARLIIADLYFDKHQWADAERYYRGILAGAESRVHPTARYKLGWIRVYQENFREALDLFKESVVTAELMPAAKLKRGTHSRPLDIRREALLAMVWPFSEVRRAYQVEDFFKPLADTRMLYLEVLRKLANRYTVRERPLAAATVLREVVKISTDGELNLDAVEKIVNTVADLPPDDPVRHSAMLADVQGLAQTYTQLSLRPQTTVKRIGAPDIDATKAYAALEIQARDRVTKAHKSAQDTQDRALQTAASQAYATYLDNFVSSLQRPIMRANLATALLESQQFLPAAITYEEVAKQRAQRGEQDEKQNIEADVYHAVSAYYDALEVDRLKRQSSPARIGTLDRLALLRAREGLKQLGTFYVHNYPKSDKVPQVRFNVARMFYQQGELREAAKLFVGFVDAYPGDKDAPTAGRLALDALSQLDELETMKKLAQHFGDNNRIQDANFRAESARLATAVGKRQVEVTVVSAPQGEFGERMLQAWSEHKGSAEGEQYLYAAFSKFKTERKLDEAQSFGDKLMGAYPHNKWAAEVMASLGGMAAQMTDFERAAAIYEQYAQALPQDAQSRVLLKNAAQMRDLLGDNDDAVRDYRFLFKHADNETRSFAQRRLLELAAQSGAWDTVAEQASSTNTQDMFFAGLAAAHSGALQKAHQLFAAVAQRPTTGEDAPMVARARFELAHMTHAAFSVLDYGDAASAERVLKQKLALLQEAEGQYVSAIQVGEGTWGIAASYELSRLYRAIGGFIGRAPLPKGVSEKDYRAALKEQSQPYADRAKQTLAACAKKAEQFKVFTPFAAACMHNESGEVDADNPKVRLQKPTDQAYLAQMRTLRQGLMANPNDTAILTKVAQRAVSAGDYYSARVALFRLDELGSSSAKGLLGVVLWHLGDLPAAGASLALGHKHGDIKASVNLAGLYASFGYKQSARLVMPTAKALKKVDLTAPDIHPIARQTVQKRGSL